jgi:hypothetical protein
MAMMKDISPVKDCRQDQDALDRAASADAREGIRLGLKDARKGRRPPVREFLEEIEARYRPTQKRSSMRGPILAVRMRRDSGDQVA